MWIYDSIFYRLTTKVCKARLLFGSRLLAASCEKVQKSLLNWMTHHDSIRSLTFMKFSTASHLSYSLRCPTQSTWFRDQNTCSFPEDSEEQQRTAGNESHQKSGRPRGKSPPPVIPPHHSQILKAPLDLHLPTRIMADPESHRFLFLSLPCL